MFRARQFARTFAQRKHFSSAAGHEDHTAIMETWRGRSLKALPVLAALAVYNVFVHLSHGDHHHEHERVKYAYEKKLDKKYPWGPGDCNYLDYDCYKHHYEAAAGKKGGH